MTTRRGRHAQASPKGDAIKNAIKGTAQKVGGVVGAGLNAYLGATQKGADYINSKLPPVQNSGRMHGRLPGKPRRRI